MNSIQLMSDVVHYMKDARYLPEKKRRETWEENANRVRDMHIRRYPALTKEITDVFADFVAPKKVVPAMRSMQFGGQAIEFNESRIFNCCFLHVDDRKAFREIAFLLLGGTGVGYSVQRHHVAKLPPVRKPTRTKKYMVSDNMIGWANAVDVLMRAYLDNGFLPIFDYRDIRPKGSPLKVSGGKAPGPEPLKRSLTRMQAILDAKESGQKLTPLECHDLNCHIADFVYSGGIREAAMIALFTMEDVEMFRCKSNFNARVLDESQVNENLWQVVVEVNGWMPARQHTVFIDKERYAMLKNEHKLPWWCFEPQRGRANNSAIFIRGFHTEATFNGFWKQVETSKCGEPAIILTNDPEWGFNPCVEGSLRAMQYCNLTEGNLSKVKTQTDLEAQARALAFIGTLQAGYTNFHYLRDEWKEVTEQDALLGVSFTGWAGVDLKAFNWEAAARVVLEENERVAAIIGIKPAARTTMLKPGGTTSCIFGTSSGIHAWKDLFYIRRLRLNKIEALYNYLMDKVPSLIEDSLLDPGNTAYLCIPIKAPDGAITEESETALEFLERVKYVYSHWVKPGHRSGANTHNVSATVKIKPGEWGVVGQWMWENRDSYAGLAVLPHDGGSYVQAPFESITEERYNELIGFVADIDLTGVVEVQDETTRAQEQACASGVCEMVS